MSIFINLFIDQICMTKSFLFPEINSERALPAPNENGSRRCFSPGSFAVFERCGFAASGIFAAGCAAPPPPPVGGDFCVHYFM